MNRTETLAVMSILKAAYPSYYRDMKRQDAEAVVNLWAEMLADYPANLVAAAVKSHIASDRKGFPPHIGAIIAAIGEISRPAELSEGEAWALIAKALRNSGYNSEKEFLFTQILKLTSKGNLKGLADLDIYTNCNIQSQFSNQSHSRYAPASAALTIDEKLAKALRNSNTHHISSGKIICGPGNEDDNKAKIEAFLEEYKRMRESEQRHRIAIEARRDFMKELISIGFFSE